uniref:IBB domain-containing protein n=1 Tax=Aegilops tauschii subsp. strangulata TaxID=200361 RepID=A0A453EZY0_AEGTS
ETLAPRLAPIKIRRREAREKQETQRRRRRRKERELDGARSSNSAARGALARPSLLPSPPLPSLLLSAGKMADRDG